MDHILCSANGAANRELLDLGADAWVDDEAVPVGTHAKQILRNGDGSTTLYR